MNEINFKVPLTGSMLFDMNAYATAKNLCDKVPGLKFEYNKNEITIYGELTDFWLQQWNEMVFRKTGGFDG